MLDITPTQGFPHMYDFVDKTMSKGANPLVLIVLTVVIMVYYLLFSYLGVSKNVAVASTSGSAVGITFIEVLLWGIFIFLVLINGLQYFFKVDIKTSIKNLFSPTPEVDIAIITPSGPEENDTRESDGTIPEIMEDPQVFHIPDNKYTYGDANAVCAAYGAKLANYSQIEKSYKDGGEWCGYGWSADQMALYPTQQNTWKKLQTIKGHKHDCGRPGINGGFIGNENVKFGINCYGYKPKMTPQEHKLMENSSIFPKTKQERNFEKKVGKYRQTLPDILVSPFNYDQWSQV
tara:strand:- start:27991 stop:28860 length:870 start_codon:yes stop_codon:yes gene_type:complete